MEVKTCSCCGLEKPLDEFYKQPKGHLGRRSECKLCKRLADAQHYRDNAERIREQVKAHRKQLFARIAEKKLKCIVCGETHPAVLQFHHRDPSEKENNVSSLAYYASEEKLLLEMEKCDVYCSNCHFKLHWNEKQ